MIAPVTLRGRFVLLEPLSAAHAPAMRQLGNGPRESFRWTTVPTPEAVDGYLAKALEMVARGQAVVFATCLPSGELLGSSRLFDLQRWDWPGGDPRAGEDVLDGCEIGYTWLAASAQRTQVNTEAKLLMLRHAFETWKCRRVTLKTDARNERSRRAIERIGARLDGVLRASMAAADNTPRDSAYYSILDAEWPAVQARLEEMLAR
jgi:N-acetyltransferase